MKSGRPASSPASRSTKLSTQSPGDEYRDRYGSPKSEVSSDMLECKINRKRAESDLQLLANRIALLRVEEQKALNKVTETRVRAEEILENEEAIQNKIQQNLAREMQIKETQAKAALERAESRRKLAMSKKQLVDTRKLNAGQRKAEADKLEEVAMQNKTIAEQEKRNKTLEEKRRREAQRRQKEQEQREKDIQTQQLYQQRMIEEARRKQEAENMINILENEEKELIKRLKKTQELQQKTDKIGVGMLGNLMRNLMGHTEPTVEPVVEPVVKKAKKRSVKKKKKPTQSQLVTEEVDEFVHQSDSEGDEPGEKGAEFANSQPRIRIATANQLAMDDHNCERNDEIARKFSCTRDVVDKLISKMFDSGLKYDDYDSICKYVADRVSASNVESPKVLTPNVINKSKFDFVNDSEENQNQPMKTYQSFGASSFNGNIIVSSATKKPVVNQSSTSTKTLQMVERLDIAAAHSSVSMYDSLQALVAWAKVSLDEEKLDSNIDVFFQSHALELLLCTIFTDIRQWTTTEPIRSTFVTLLQLILQVKDVKVIQPIIDTLDQLLTQLHTIRSTKTIPAIHYDVYLGSRTLAKYIAESFQKSYVHFVRERQSKQTNRVKQKQEFERFIQELEEINEQLTRINNNNNNHHNGDETQNENIGNLFASREMRLDKLQLCIQNVEKNIQYETALQASSSSSLSTTTTSNKNNNNSSSSSNSTKKSLLDMRDIERTILSTNKTSLEQLLLTESKTSSEPLEMKVQQANQMNNELSKLLRDRDIKLNGLAMEMNDCNNRLFELNAMRERLLQQLEFTDRDIAALSAHRTILENTMNETQVAFNNAIGAVHQSKEYVQASLQIHDNLKPLIQSISNFEIKFVNGLIHTQLQQQELETTKVSMIPPPSPRDNDTTGSTTTTDNNKKDNSKNNNANALASPTNKSSSSSNTTIITSTSNGMKISNNTDSTNTMTSVSPIVTTNSYDSIASLVPLLSDTLSSYIQTESECIKFLANRVKSAQAVYEKQNKELQAFKSLSMKALIGELEVSIAKVAQEIKEDIDTINYAQTQLSQSLLKFAGFTKSNIFPEIGKIQLPTAQIGHIVTLCREIGIVPLPELLPFATFTNNHHSVTANVNHKPIVEVNTTTNNKNSVNSVSSSVESSPASNHKASNESKVDEDDKAVNGVNNNKATTSNNNNNVSSAVTRSYATNSTTTINRNPRPNSSSNNNNKSTNNGGRSNNNHRKQDKNKNTTPSIDTLNVIQQIGKATASKPTSVTIAVQKEKQKVSEASTKSITSGFREIQLEQENLKNSSKTTKDIYTERIEESIK